MSLENQVNSKIEDARKLAESPAVSQHIESLETDAIRGFVHGTYNLEKLKELWGNIPKVGGRVYFNTLPEFIIAVRSVIDKKEEQDEILDHENAHAVEALQRGYSIRYGFEFTKDVQRFLIIKITRQGIHAANVDFDLFDKDGVEPEEHELREDMIAMLSAPENVTDGEMSDTDRNMLGGS